MYGFSLNNNIAGQQMDPLQRFGATQLGFGSLPGAPNGQYGGSTDSISPFGGGGYASNPGFGWNGASNGGLNGGIFGGFGSSSSAGLASMLGSFGSYVQNLFGQIAQWIQNYSGQLQTAASGQSSASGQGSSFGSAAGSYAGQCANGQSGSAQCTNGTQQGLGTQQGFGPQQYFTSADASSVGDPHDAFNGTSSTNGNLSNRWDDMRSHAQLLSSDSFRGGYRVSTRASQPTQTARP